VESKPMGSGKTRKAAVPPEDELFIHICTIKLGKSGSVYFWKGAHFMLTPALIHSNNSFYRIQ